MPGNGIAVNDQSEPPLVPGVKGAVPVMFEPLKVLSI